MGGDNYHGPVGVDGSDLIPTVLYPIPDRLRRKAASLKRLMKAIDDAEEYLERRLEELECEFSELECEIGIDDERHDPGETDEYVEG